MEKTISFLNQKEWCKTGQLYKNCNTSKGWIKKISKKNITKNRQ